MCTITFLDTHLLLPFQKGEKMINFHSGKRFTQIIIFISEKSTLTTHREKKIQFFPIFTRNQILVFSLRKVKRKKEKKNIENLFVHAFVNVLVGYITLQFLHNNIYSRGMAWCRYGYCI